MNATTAAIAPMETRWGNLVYCAQQTSHARPCHFCGSSVGYYRHPGGYPACLVCGDLWIVDREYGAPVQQLPASETSEAAPAAPAGPSPELQAAAVMAAITAIRDVRKPSFFARVRRKCRSIFG